MYSLCKGVAPHLPLLPFHLSSPQPDGPGREGKWTPVMRALPVELKMSTAYARRIAAHFLQAREPCHHQKSWSVAVRALADRCSALRDCRVGRSGARRDNLDLRWLLGRAGVIVRTSDVATNFPKQLTEPLAQVEAA
jgi:hypothetical protein